MRTYQYGEIGVEVQTAEIEALLNDSRSGGFFCIRLFGVSEE